MTTCPLGHCLCRTVQSESARIWNDLQDAQMLNSPIHEDTITQNFALTLNRQHTGENRVHLFNRAAERQNGSDFLWLFFSGDLSRHFRVAVQAKRLYPDGTYSAFKRAQGEAMQSYAASIAAQPIYLFYNFQPPGAAPHLRFHQYHRMILMILGGGQDFGATYVPTDLILDITTTSLSFSDIERWHIPLWIPFCNCNSGRPPDPLGGLANSFRGEVETTTRPIVDILETSEELFAWMSGKAAREGMLDEMFSPEEASSDNFTPSFICGTRLGDAEVQE